MFSATEMTVSVIRVCGHSESEEIRYKGTREKNEILRYARRDHCKTCKQTIKAWFETPDAMPYDLNLPSLVGSDKQVAWALKIRASRASSLLKIMTLAANHGDRMGEGLWRAIYAFLIQRQAKYWIDTREETFGPDYFALEAAYFAMGITVGIIYSPRSVYGRYKLKAPYVIDDIKRIQPIVSMEKAG